MKRGILLNENNEPVIRNGSMAIGNTEMQNVALILQLQQGGHKFAPTLGPNLIQLKKANASRWDIEQRVRVHLAKDGIDYNQVKQQLTTIK